MPDAPFDRTVCACRSCTDCCKEQPGFLVPGDLERIAAYLAEPPADALRFFWASPGAVVMDSLTGRTARIGTITPRADGSGRCVFLDDADRCRIHPVAPFGCAFFDTHMPSAQAQDRSLYGHAAVAGSAEYARTRGALPAAASWRPRGYGVSGSAESRCLRTGRG